MKESIALLGKILTNILTALYEPFGFSFLFLSWLCFSTYMPYKPSAAGKGWKKILRQSGKVAFIFLDRDVAVIASFGYVPAVGYLLLHSRRNARRRVLLGDNGDKKMSIKRDETMI